MPELNLDQKLRKTLNSFLRELKFACQHNLVATILYGSGSSGEFVDRHSDLNLLVVLENIKLENLKKAAGFINKKEFQLIHPLFMSEEYIKSSSDVFPIEFLDMQENYIVLFGKDILKGISIDTKNLRFQCEQELRTKLIFLRQSYLRNSKDKTSLSGALFKTFNSTLHILRNVLRLKGRKPAYLKQEIVKEVAAEFGINIGDWEKILAAKNKQVRLSAEELDKLFQGFTGDLGSIVDSVDKF